MRIGVSGGGDIVFAVRERVVKGERLVDIATESNLYEADCRVWAGSTVPIGAPRGPWDRTLDKSIHPEVLILFRPGQKKPIVLGRFTNSEVVYRDDGDYGDTGHHPDASSESGVDIEEADKNDHVQAFNGVKQASKVSGDFGMQVPGTADFQVGHFRITAADKADDRLPSLSVLIELLNTIIVRVNELSLWGSTVLAPSGTTGGPLVPPFQTPTAIALPTADEVAVPGVTVPSP